MDSGNFIYREHRRFFAVVNEGLEELVAAELERLGAFRIRAIRRGVHFHADPAQALDILFGSRLVGRILAPLAEFDCHSSKYMHRRAAQIPWEELIDPAKTFAVSATVVNSKATHSQYVSLVLKDAICDRMREKAGQRPSVDRREPDLRAHVHLEDNFATVSIDLGDGSRHRRGYRPDSGDAPLPETVAAALLELAQFDGTRPLLDPMCGSGTLLAEAFMRAAAIPAGYRLQRGGARLLPGFGPDAFEEARKKWLAPGRWVEDGLIRGNDIDRQQIVVAGENLSRLPGGDEIRLRRGDFRDHPGLEDGLIVCNPPWGIRIGDEAAAQVLVREFGDFLKQKCKGSDAWLILGNRELIKHVGLRAARRVPVRIGGLDGRFVNYELH